MRELPERLRQRGQLVAGDVEGLQLRELPDPLWQHRQAFACEIKLGS